MGESSSKQGYVSMLTTDSDRVEVEWKYILKLHPDESQRPKPSANAKPLPVHMKESDASLDITNRTDGVPEIGDPFNDPHSEHKWGEWHTAPGVIQRVAKVDLSKENHLWYYIGKPSTEARPQYTEDPAKQRNNPKSNFLDTVKPLPPPVPVFTQRSYPASYTLKPAPIAVPPRTPMYHQLQPAGRPYEYKPKEKESYMTTWKSPVYNPDTRKNPNSPVAHQPNVSYDHRPPTQAYGTPYQGYHHHRPPSQSQAQPQSQPRQQQQEYIPYVPPPAQSQTQPTANWKAQPATSGPLLNDIDQYAHTSQSRALPPYSFPQPNAQSPRQPSAYPYPQGSGQNPSTVYSPPVPYSPVGHAPSGRASISNMLSNPTGPPRPTMYAVTPSSFVCHAAQSPSEYFLYLKKYPYLKNAYLRRAKTYVSPYSPEGGFTQEWMPKLPAPSMPTGLAPKLSGSAPQGFYHGRLAPNLPAPRPMAQFQSSDAFQRDMARTTQSADAAPKWEKMLKQLATSNGPTALPTATAGAPQTPQARLPHPSSRSGMHYDTPRSMQSMPTHTPPFLPSREPQRPTPSPISDDGTGVVAVPTTQDKPTLPPLQPAPQLHGAETWRYT
jgi:hypothetical protein